MDETEMIRWVALAIFAMFWAGYVTAQTQDGQLGEGKSTGIIEVSVNIEKVAPKLSITGLSSVNFDKTVGESATSDQTISACVYIDQDVTYSVSVEAGPLLDGSVNYPYDLVIDQGGLSSSPMIELSVSGEVEPGNAPGFTASMTPDCGPDTLDVTFKDKGAADAQAPFTASATVTITVMPD